MTGYVFIQSLSNNTFVSKQVMAFFSEAFGLEVPEAVALLGAHTIGHMHRDGSGYTGAWKERGVSQCSHALPIFAILANLRV